MSVGGVGSSGPIIPDEPEPPKPVSGGYTFDPLAKSLPPPPTSWLNLVTPGGIDLSIRPNLDYNHQASNALQVQGDAALAALDAPATANTTGPEAKLRAFIKGQMDDALRSIRADEDTAKKLPLDSPERRKLEDQIDARAARYRNDVTVETLRTADAIKKRPGGDGALAKFTALLPGYLQEAVKRGGLHIPGVPGAVRPRTDNGVLGGPTGLDYKVEW
jgi:hypothetical protein